MSKTGFNFMSLPDTTARKVQGAAFWGFNDPVTGLLGAMTSIGSVAADLDIKTEYLDLRDNQLQRRGRIGRRATIVDGTVKLTIEQFNGTGLTQLLMSPYGATVTQAADVAVTTVFPVSQKYQILEIKDASGNNVFDVSAVAITDGANPGVPLVAGVDYFLDALTGIIQVSTIPASGNYSVTWSAPAIAAMQGQSTFALLQNPEQKGRLVIRQNNLSGADLLTVFPLVQWSPPTSVKMIGNGNDWATTQVEATILSASAFPGREFGYSTLIM